MNELALYVGYSVLILIWIVIAATAFLVAWIVLSLLLNAARQWRMDLKVRRQQQEWANRNHPEHVNPRFSNRGGDGAA